MSQLLMILVYKINPSDSYECVKNLEDFLKNKRTNLELENLNEIKLQKAKELEESTFCTVHIRDVLEYLDDIDDVINISKISATITQIMHNEKIFIWDAMIGTVKGN